MPVADPAPTITDQCPDIEFAPGSLRTVEGLYACAQAWATMPCADYDARKVPPSCATGGSLPDGSRCISDVQCQSDHCRRGDRSGPKCGICAPRAPPGGACPSLDDCPYDQWCSSGTCVPQPTVTAVELGRPCEPSQVCVPPGLCLADASGARTCVAPAADGASCATFGSCTYPGSYCTEALVCAPVPAAGTPCQLDAHKIVVCGAGARCDSSAPGGPLCRALPAAGEPCQATGSQNLQQSDCAPGLACVCSGASCVAGTCQRRLQQGDPCGDPGGVCVPGTTCQGGHCAADETRNRMTELCGP
jgi:hypothetical protein